MPVDPVAAAESFGMRRIRSATATASPSTSTGFPLERSGPARSTTVGSNPRRRSQYASVVPAIPAPEIRILGMFLTPPSPGRLLC
jgi:hypothetical protein